MTILWHKKAKADFSQQVRYCNNRFGKKAAREYQTEVFNRIDTLASFPYMGVCEPLLSDYTEGFRAMVVRPQVKLIYFVDEKKDVIHIVRLWDTRREPLEQAKNLW